MDHQIQDDPGCPFTVSRGAQAFRFEKDGRLPLHHIGEFQDGGIEALHMAHMKDKVSLFGHIDELHGIFVDPCHGLFQEDMLAGLQAPFGHFVMLRRRDGDVHSIHVGKKVLIIVKGFCPVKFGDLIGPAFPDITDPHKIDIFLQLMVDPGVIIPHMAHTDDPHA